MDCKIREKINQKSISLENYELNDLAWTKEDALALIDSIINDEIGILGGDVCKITSSHLEFLYDNWSCEIDENELKEKYYSRSKIESKKYIENYPVNPEEGIIFSITFTDFCSSSSRQIQND